MKPSVTRRRVLTLPLAIASMASRAASPVLQVGPGRAIRTLAEASRRAVPGSTIEVDAGTYAGDVAAWAQDDLTLRAVGGRVLLRANGAAMEDKGIWVVRARNFTAEGFDFDGASVGSGNGSGIRLERGTATVRDCRFTHNDTGILSANRPDIELTVERCEFAHDHRIDGQNHHLYAGAIRRLSVSGSYFHHAEIGHLLKSRAASNYIVCNRLTDERGGHASYELEFPNGGLAVVVGNVIEQSDTTENPNMISYGAEGYAGLRNELHLVNNTLVDDRAQSGVFLRVSPGPTRVRMINNLFVNRGGQAPRIEGRVDDQRGNATLARSALVAQGDFEYMPLAADGVPLSAVDPGEVDGRPLAPRFEYAHPRATHPLYTAVTRPGSLPVHPAGHAMNAQATSNRLPGIEAARGVAATMVVFYHAARHMKLNIGYLPWSGVAQFGHAGVDFFFVLSGFIILRVHARDIGHPARLPHYAQRRFTRIYPLYWAVILMSLGLGLAFSRNHPPDFGFVLQSATLLPTHGDPYIGVAWTLQHEFAFYLVFAIALANAWAGAVAMAAWLALIVVRWALPAATDLGLAAEMLASSFNIEFFFGMAAAGLALRRPSERPLAWLLAGAAIFLGFGVVENLGRFDGYAPGAHLAYGASAMLMVIGLGGVARLRGPGSRMLATLGAASYSIYLTHLIFIGIAYKLAEVSGLFRATPPWLMYPALTACGIGGGIAVSRWIEYPLMAFVRRRLARAPDGAEVNARAS